MAPYIPVIDTCMMEARFTLNGEQCEVTTYYQLNGASVASAAPDIGASYVDNVILNLLNVMAPELTWTELYFTDLTTQFAPTFSYTTDLPISGSGILPGEANGVALVMCYRTGGRGRSRRGRNYFGGFIETAVVNSQFTPAIVTGVKNALLAHRTAVANAGFPQVVVSRQENNVPRAIGATFVVTDIVNVSPKTKSMRTRNPD